jgi:hypothetical protein
MGLYDEVSVMPNNRVNIPPPKELYQTNSLDSAMRDVSIDKDGFIHYDTEPDRVINTIEFNLYGEDHTGYHRKYLLAVIMNKIEGVWEKEDDGTYTEIFLNPGIKVAAKRMAHRMTPLHPMSPK